MAWDLWESPHDQDTVEGSDSMQSECQCDFYFGYGHDVIEEQALNEKYCIQVLRILITKEDTEIDELEENLVSLQTELAFAEHKEWFELCCNALREKIDCLDISVRTLRNKCEKDAELQSSMHREPAETIHDILKGLLSNFFQEKDKQPSQVTILDLKSNDSADSSKLCESRELSELKSGTLKEETGEADTPTETCTSMNSSSQLQEMKTKSADTNTTDSGQNYLKLSPGSSDEEKQMVMGESHGTTRQQNATAQELNFTDTKVIENASLKPEERSCEMEVVEDAESIAKASSSSSLESSNSCFNMGKGLCENDMKANGNKEVNGGVKKQHYFAPADFHHERNRGHDRTYEHSNAIVNYIGPDAIIRSAALKEMNKTSEFKVSTSSPAKTDNCDVDQKLIDIKRTARKEGIKDSKAFVLNKFNSSNSWSRTVVNGRDDRQIVTNTQHLALALQAQLGKNTIKAELELGEPVVEESNKAVIAGCKTHLNLDQQLQSPKTKRKFQSDSQSIIGPIFPPTERKLNASSVSAYKRQKSDSVDDNASLKQLMSGKHLKKSAQLECHTKEHGTSLAVAEHSFSPQESKRTGNLQLNAHMKDSSVNLNVSESLGHATHSGSVDNDPNARALVQLPLPIEKLKGMKVQQLKAIAKENDMKNYSKLKKEQLIQFLTERLGNRIYR